jgi:hypothetical protein
VPKLPRGALPGSLPAPRSAASALLAGLGQGEAGHLCRGQSHMPALSPGSPDPSPG